MGVGRKDYIVYGWKLPYEISNQNGEIDFYDDKFSQMYQGQKGEEFTLIVDGMCGDYAVFGLNVKSNNNEWEGWDFVDLDFNNFKSEKVKDKYKELFEMEAPSDPKLFIFSHFS